MSSLDELYLQRRMGILGRAQDLSPSMQFDLATSALGNHELEQAVEHFNPKPQKEGWGFANVFEEMLSREPRRVPVEDLATLQNNLKQQGYLDSSHPADGTWGPDSAAAFSQFDRDNADQVRQGNSILAGTVQDGIRYFGTMLPRSVIQGVIGTAKGIYHQTPETFERAGALGGAGIALGIGAAAAPFTGGLSLAAAGAWAAGGFVIGGLFSLLDNDDEDGNENKGLLDALHPFNEGEWTTARNFAEDMGYVATVASVVRGGATIGAGLKSLAPSTLSGSLAALDPVTKPGFVMNLLGSAKGSAALGAFGGGAHGLAVGDDFGDVLEEAAVGGAAGFALGASPVGAKLRDLAARFGLKRIMTNPVVAGVNKTFTGGVQINVGGRYAGGFGSGEKDTAIEKSIREAPVVLPEWADWIGGLVLLPERMTPIGLGEIGSAARKMAGDVSRKPYFHALETVTDAMGNVLPKKKVREIVDSITPEQDLWTREQYGIHQLTKWSLESKKAEEGADFFARADIENVYQTHRNEVMDWYQGDPESVASKKNLLMALSTEDPSDYAGYLVKLEAKGSGVQSWPRYEPAQLEAENLALAAREGQLEYTLGGKPPVAQVAEGQVKTATDNLNFVAADPKYMTQRDWNGASDDYVRLFEEAKRAKAAADSIPDDVATVEQKRVALQEAANARDELQAFVRTFRDPLNQHRSLPEKIVDMALDGRQVKHYKVVGGKKKLDKETYEFADFLKKKATHAGTDVDLANPDLARTITDNGYKLIATGENMRMLGEVKELAAVHSVGDYTKRAAFFEAAGLSPFAVTEKEVGQLKQVHMDGNLNTAMNELGISTPGSEAVNALVDKMHAINNHGFRHGPFVTAPGDKSLIRRTKLLKVDLRQLKLEDIVDALKLDSGILTKVDDPLKAAQVVKDYIHRGMGFGSEVRLGPAHWADTTRRVASAMRVEGLTGFSDFMRQFHITNPPRALMVAGGVAGAGIGAQEEGLEGAIKGGIGGTLAMGTLAYGGKAALAKWPSKSPFKPGTYGWLPNNLHNAAMAMRYSLSFTFDLGRRMEQAQIASLKYGMPVVLAPKSYARHNFVDDFGGVDQVMTGLHRQLDEVMGSKVAMNADDMDRRAAAVGLTGFSQRDADAVYAHIMIKSGKFNPRQVRDAVHTLGHYPPRTGFERSLNFVLFPFSFQKKMLTTINDFMLAEPARALLVHEGMRQWYKVRDPEASESMSSRFAEITEKYLPLAAEIGRLNNLSYGLSPGRFFLEGMSNNKTLNGKVMQSLASVFTPSGAVTPLQQAAGKAGDQMVNFFSPIFLTGEDTENFISIFEDFSPAVRDVRRLALGEGANKPSVLSQQLTAATEREAIQVGGGGAPWYQLREFNNEKRAIKAEYEDLAAAFDYSTVDGFLNSEMGAPYAADVEARVAALGDKYPTGLLKSRFFESSTAIDDKAKAELLADPTRSVGEEMIAQIIEMEAEAASLAEMMGGTDEDMLPRLTEDIRSIATRFSTDTRFRELYDRFFEYRYGPIAEIAA